MTKITEKSLFSMYKYDICYYNFDTNSESAPQFVQLIPN